MKSQQKRRKQRWKACVKVDKKEVKDKRCLMTLHLKQIILDHKVQHFGGKEFQYQALQKKDTVCIDFYLISKKANRKNYNFL